MNESRMKLHHIGIVVPKIQDSIMELEKFPFIESISETTKISSQKVNVCFLKVGQPFLELIEPVSDDSPVSNFLKNQGGIHHLCFEVDNLEEAIKDYEQRGARLIVKPVKGFEGRQTAFIFLNTKKTNFNLIELAEKK